MYNNFKYLKADLDPIDVLAKKSSMHQFHFFLKKKMFKIYSAATLQVNTVMFFFICTLQTSIAKR